MKTEKLKAEIIKSLQSINETVCYYQEDSEVRNLVCIELRKIHERLDKLTNTK